MDYALYIASGIGAIALFMMMPRKGHTPRAVGVLIGVMALGGLWLYLSDLLASAGWSAPTPYYYVFSGLAIGAAVRVVTHPKPVYSALWFVIVVLASAGLLLVLEAEFIAAGLVIIYGGAILVTYLFVIMLAAQSGRAGATEDTPDYDRLAREPVAAVATGFLLLAVLLSVCFKPIERRAPAETDAVIIDNILTRRPAQAQIESASTEVIRRQLSTIGSQNRLTNVERVGLDLIRHHPLGLELAGVILLVALVGAIVIARKRVENGPT